MQENVTITNKTKGKLPSLPFVEIKNSVLGKKYELSVVFIGHRRSRKLNNTYRQKDKPTDILSFPLDDQNGEIYIYLKKARAEAKSFDRTEENFLAFLFIHGLCHLKGMDHGSTMERAEKTIRKKFSI